MLKKFILPAIIVIFTNCSKDSGNATPAPAPQPDSGTEAAARKMFEHFNNHAWDSMAFMYADTATFLDPTFGDNPVKRTRTQTVATYKSLAQSIPDVHDSLTHVFACGNKAVIEFISTGTLPGGGKLYLPICTVLTFENGRIVKDATYYDN